MYFELAKRAQHTGTEQYEVTFAIREQDDLYDVKGAYVQYEIRPEVVHLVWERYKAESSYGPWRRVGYRPRGGFSSIAGPRVMKDGSLSMSNRQRSFVEVFASTDLGGPLSKYAAGLPHLEQMIAELEKNLPH